MKKKCKVAMSKLEQQVHAEFERLSRLEIMSSCIYAMNALLIHKGVYTRKQFQRLFVESAKRQAGIAK